MLSVAEALERVLSGASPLPSERVPVDEAHRRALAVDIAATLTQPPFPSSAMDGYAVRRADLANLPATLRIIGESAAGRPFAGALGAGETVRIFTGAAVPEGAGHVVIQENVSAAGGTATITEVNEERFIREPGVDFREGETLLSAGRRLRACDLLLAAQANYAELPVRRRPHVAILATGDELLQPGSPLEAGRIISSIPAGLGAMLADAGAHVTRLGIARDKMDSLLDHLARADDADIIVTIGGASVGDHDLVRPALERTGFEIAFHKIAMRPGKPLMLGARGGQRVLGLPGNPVSAIICAAIFVLPLIAALTGVREEPWAEEMLPLAAPLPANGPREHYMRARYVTAGGVRSVEAMPSQDSSLTATLARAECLIVRPPRAPAIAEGGVVRVRPLNF